MAIQTAFRGTVADRVPAASMTRPLGEPATRENLMKASVSCSTVLAVCTIIVCGMRPGLAAAAESRVECADVAQRGVLNVMTLNLLFSRVHDRTARLEHIATLVRSQFEAGQPVDV